MIDPQEAAKFLEVCGYEYSPRTKLHELTRRAKSNISAAVSLKNSWAMTPLRGRRISKGSSSTLIHNWRHLCSDATLLRP